MTNPQRYVTRVFLFLLLVGIVVALVYPILLRAFMHNPALNGLILGVLLLGIVYALRRILTLRPEVRWVESFRTSGPGFSVQDPPRLLAPVAAALGERERRGRASLSSLSMRHFLDSISARMDETRDITRYQTGLLIFLGLLGTFWGLIETINAVGLVLNDLTLVGDDMALMFDGLKTGLAAPISGMGTAFSSSLFGLAGSLILGFIDLQASQAQNAFYNDTEEWLSTLTRHSNVEAPGGEGGAAPPAFLAAMLQQTAENLEHLRLSVQRGEDDRARLNGTLNALNERLGNLADTLGDDREAMRRMIDALRSGGAAGEHLRTIDAKLERLIDEAGRGREEGVRELRGEIRQLSRTIAILAEEPPPPAPKPQQSQRQPVRG